MESVPSIPVCGALFKAVNGALHIRLVTVQVAQVLVLLRTILNLLYTEGVVKTLPVVLQIDGEVAGQNADRLMG